MVNWIFVNDATASSRWGSGTPASLQYSHSQFTVLPASSTQESFYTFLFGFGSLYCYAFKKALFTVNETQNSSLDSTWAHNVHKISFVFLAT